MKIRSYVFCLFAVFIAACSVLNIEKVPLAMPQEPPPGAHPAPVGFNEIRYAIPTGTTTMGISPRSFRCPLIKRAIQRGVTGRTFADDEYKRIFKDTLGGLGYDITGDPGRMFDEREDQQRSVYSVGARVIDIKIEKCTEQSGFFGYQLGDIGEANVTIEWTVFDMLHRRSVYKTVTKGYGRLDAPNQEGLALLLENAFEAAAHNLGADKAFFELVFFGREPLNAPADYPDLDEMPLPSVDPREPVTLPPQKLLNGDNAGRLDDFRRVAVLIQTAGGHGSGFFIGRDGYILTNAHVVGHAKQARVVTSGKEDKLVADVLRRDALRDVALLKLEDKSAGLAVDPLPLRSERPAVGEDVYAVGAPLQTKLQDTVTKGIVSAVRYDQRKKQWYIQSDVFIYSGNSGGPLLDKSGNIVGLNVSGFNAGAVEVTGLNYFIPIDDALAALDIAAGR